MVWHKNILPIGILLHIKRRREARKLLQIEEKNISLDETDEEKQTRGDKW